MNDAPQTPGSRRKRRGTGGIPQQSPQSAAQALAEAERAVGAPPPQPQAKVLSIGRYERADFERVEALLAGFAQRRLAEVVKAVSKGFFTAASPQEQQLPELRTAFYSFLLYGWRDQSGVRVVDLFRRIGPGLEGRQLAALDACAGARLGLVAVDDVTPHKQRLRGRDILRGEAVTVRDQTATKQLRPGDRLLGWLIPWGTSWQLIGVATQVEARKAQALDRALESMAAQLRAGRRDLADRHAANLFWVVYRVASLRA